MNIINPEPRCNNLWKSNNLHEILHYWLRARWAPLSMPRGVCGSKSSASNWSYNNRTASFNCQRDNTLTPLASKPLKIIFKLAFDEIAGGFEN